jgi:hypothetical protein
VIRRATTRARGRVHEPGAAAGQRAGGGEGEVEEGTLSAEVALGDHP